jgi:molecular chaperone GrpE (heat shock protein)
MLGQQPQPERQGANNYEDAERINWQKGMQGNPMLSQKAFDNLKSQVSRIDADIADLNNKIAEANDQRMKKAFESVRAKLLSDKLELEKSLGIKPSLQ